MDAEVSKRNDPSQLRSIRMCIRSAQATPAPSTVVRACMVQNAD